MIHICDAIMGSGKSQSAISMMNENPDRRFIYITPYLDEAKRIRDNCPDLHFIEPSDKIKDCGFSKIEHTRKLISEGRNITSTHAAFKLYTADMIDDITRYGYTLIIDEAVNVLEEAKITRSDVALLARAGLIRSCADGSQYEKTDIEYGDGVFNELFRMIDRNNLLCLKHDGDQESDALFIWSLHPEVMKSFRDVYILTYLFDGQDIKYYLEANHMEYDRIGIRRNHTTYTFADKMEYLPEYISRLDSMIHIVDNERINAIGAGKFSLSSNWYKASQSKDGKDILRKNLHTFHKSVCNNAPASRLLWTTFKEYEQNINGHRYKKQFLSCTTCATNEYRDRDILAYLVNMFANPFKKRYIQERGYEWDEDLFALGNMLQWVWRSAIRDGKEIMLYVPSERMRNLLKNWIAQTMATYRNHIGEEVS